MVGKSVKIVNLSADGEGDDRVMATKDIFKGGYFC